VIRTRFAPSPTGSLHVGNARIAVLNWLFTRKRGGSFILRIEDTDVERNVAGAEAGIRDDLLWLGLDWDEGPDHAQGAYGPYRQSERMAHYQRYALRLLDAGSAYRCFCNDEPQGDVRTERRSRCSCADLDPAAAAARATSAASIIRFRVLAGRNIVVEDAVRSPITVASDEIADFVLLRSDGRPTYNFAVVVDDIEMEISHVIRGVGHLSNTPRQLLLYEALENRPPAFVHVPMVLGPDRQKLSKRHGAAGMAEYRAAGYHPDALVNYLSLLSWSSPSGDEVLDRDRLIDEVTIERIGVADVVFDPVKLRWLSAKHIERMELDDLVAAVRPCVDRDRFRLDTGRLRAAVAATRTHLSTFRDINEQLAAFFPESTDGAVTHDATAARVLPAAARVLSGVSTWTEPALKSALDAIGREAQVRGRALYEPLRRALTARDHGPPLAAILYVQGRDAVLGRLTPAAPRPER
jgi:nondiscriminating glutamyl-tRNA synthetase